MSQDSIERIIGKLMLDSTYRDAFLANPEQAISPFVLTNAEKDYLKRMDAETLDQLAHWFARHSRQWQVNNFFIANPK